eukprot:6037426-Prymnesium_polylepis.1
MQPSPQALTAVSSALAAWSGGSVSVQLPRGFAPGLPPSDVAGLAPLLLRVEPWHCFFARLGALPLTLGDDARLTRQENSHHHTCRWATADGPASTATVAITTDPLAERLAALTEASTDRHAEMINALSSVDKLLQEGDP